MHDSALRNGERFFATYVAQLGPVTVVDIGAQDVNGSLKDVCPGNARYVGVDFTAAKGVDIVLTDPYKLPFPSESLDVIVSSSCFEHSEMFWVLYLEILRTLKPSGLFYLNAPSNGEFHRFPVDCYRFYPDSGNALAKWAQMNGHNSIAIESYTSNQGRSQWNDYVCIFIKDAKHLKSYPRRILHTFSDFTNGSMYSKAGETAFLNPTELQEDQRGLGWKLKNRIARLLSNKS